MKNGFMILKTCFALGKDITAVKDFVEDELINSFSPLFSYLVELEPYFGGDDKEGTTGGIPNCYSSDPEYP